jgi:hypothetical protein
MTPIQCPNCGAPAQVHPGQTIATCAYCKQSFQVQPAMPAASLPQPLPPGVILVQAGSQQVPLPPPRRSRGGCAAVSGLLPLVILGAVGYFVWNGMRAGGLVAAGWTGAEPLVCGGNELVEATGATASYTSGAAIDASGNCHVKCTRCTIKAPVGVAAGGNAQVMLVDSQVEGAPQGIVAGGNASVRLLGNSTLQGATLRSGNAEVTAPPGAPTPPRSAPAAPTPTPTPTPAPRRPSR